jgi:adenosylcobyric acid synthase
MLGRTIADPIGVESKASTAHGLGLLPIDTTMAADKTTQVCSATTRGGVAFSAYEIHMGVTAIDAGVESFARLDGGRADGACVGRVSGTYLHGALENAAVCSELLGVPVAPAAAKREQYERLADWFEQHGRGLGRLGVV